MRKDQLRTYKTNRDVNIKTQRKLKKLSEAQIAEIRKRRKAFNDKRKQNIKRDLTKREGRRNINVLTPKQKARRNKRIKREIAKRNKLLYNKTGGDIAFRKVLEGVEWKDNFVSSNVWKFKRKQRNLLVQFMDGSIYLYFNVGKKFIGLLNAGSKGKWVWRILRRQKVNYVKIK